MQKPVQIEATSGIARELALGYGINMERLCREVCMGWDEIRHMADDPLAPWGGFKFSGVGREYGRYGIEAFLETRAILES